MFQIIEALQTFLVYIQSYLSDVYDEFFSREGGPRLAPVLAFLTSLLVFVLLVRAILDILMWALAGICLAILAYTAFCFSSKNNMDCSIFSRFRG